MTFGPLATAFGLFVGHIAFCIWLVNVTHSVGLDERRMNRLSLLLFALIGLSTLSLCLLISFRPPALWPSPPRLYRGFCLVIAGIVLPASLLAGVCRRVPPDTFRVETDETEDLGHDLVSDHDGSQLSWMLRLPGNESFHLRRISLELAIPRLTESLAGLTILHISDTHFSPAYPRRYFDSVVRRAAEGGPYDLVLFTGDLIDHESSLEWVCPLFSELRGRLGQFAILGNHDVPHRPGRVRKALRSAGFTVIDGRWASLLVPGSDATIALGGTSAPWGPALSPESQPEADLTIVLSHTPDLFPQKLKWGVDLLLAGHNHGGQIRLPWLGPILMPSRYSRRYDRGIFRTRETVMHVSPGVGGKHPVRYGCPPEIARLRLVPALGRSGELLYQAKSNAESY